MNPIARFLSVAFSAAFLSPFAFAADFTVNPAIGQVFADVLSAPTTFTTGLRYEVLTTAPNNAFKVEDGQAKKDGQPVNPSTLSPLEKGTVALTYKPADAGEMPNLSYALSSHFSRITVPNIVSLRYTVTEGSATTTYESFYDVTAIADAAFKADQGSGILSISFTAGNSISSIGKDAFRGVNNLNSITWTTLTNLTTISPNAFKGCRSLITQSDGDLEKLTKLISLGDSAFAETILSSVTLAAASLQSLGKHAFADIPTLTTVTLSDCHALSPAFLTKDVFGSNLTGIVFPNTYIASIPDAAFQGCGNLSSVTFPKRVTRIGNSAFANCPLLTTLAWPDGRTVPAVEVIGNSAFKNTALTALDFTKEANGGFFPGIKYIEAEAFAGVSAPLTLPSTILSVGQAAFDAVTIANLSQLLQGSPLLEGINKKMFGSTPSTKLTTITLPTWLTFIEEAAFQGCTNLQTVNWINLANLKEIRKNAFKETAVGKDGKLLGTETGLPKLTALESIEESAFSAVAIPVGNLTPLTLPQSLQYLGPNAFANNQGLTSVNLSTNTNLKTLTPYHSSITSTDKPLVTLNSAMFGRWLSSISFPSNLTAIADNAFKDAAALTTLANFSSLNNLLSIGAAAFEATQVGPSLSWPSTPSITSIAPRAFYNAAISTTTADYFTLPSTLTSLGDSAFAANPALTKLSLKNNTTTPLLALFESKLNNSTPPPPLFTYAHWFGSAITHFTYPSSQSFTGANAWNGHKKLQVLTLPSAPAPALTINSASFKNAFDPTYTTVTIPASVTAIDAEAFANNAGLTTLTFAENSALRSIGQKAFYNIPCNSTTLNLSTDAPLLQSIGDSAFIFSTNSPKTVDLSSLTSLTSPVTKKVFGSHLITLHLPTNTATIPADAFKNVSSLNDINLDALTSLTSIADSAFAATSITSLALPAQVTSLGSGAFVKNPALKTLDLTAATSLPSSFINKKTFGSALTEIKFPTTLDAISDYAFQGLTNLTTLTNFSSLNSLLSIGTSAFENTKVGNLSWPSKITTIAARAFYNSAISTAADNAPDFTLPSSLTSLGDSAFAGNTALTKLSLKDNTPLIPHFENKLINSTPPPPPTATGSAPNSPTSPTPPPKPSPATTPGAAIRPCNNSPSPTAPPSPSTTPPLKTPSPPPLPQ